MDQTPALDVENSGARGPRAGRSICPMAQAGQHPGHWAGVYVAGASA
jgi:hypothetical protein